MYKLKNLNSLSKKCGQHIYFQVKNSFRTDFIRMGSITNIGKDTLKNSILKSSLPFVHQYGWSKQAMEKGANSIGCPKAICQSIIQNEADLVHYYYKTCNERLITLMKNGDISSDIPSNFIHSAVEARLRMVLPYIKNWKEALRIMTGKTNTKYQPVYNITNIKYMPKTLALLLSLTDNICYYAGYKNEEESGYLNRRICLAIIYRMCEVKLLEDTSPNYQETWQYTKDRIDEALQMETDLERVVDEYHFTEIFNTVEEILQGE